ncbi:hypothetical protein D3C84_1170560 [compost metagenome]
MPRQVQALCEPGLIGQIDFDIVRDAPPGIDVAAGNVIDLLQPCRAFGQGHQFLFKLHRIG